MHDEARSGRPSLVNDDLVRKVNERALSSDFKDSMTLSVVANIAGGRII